MNLYDPPDLFQANESWGANCGPCALAAVLGRPLEEVRNLCPHFTPDHRYTTPTDMRRSLGLAGVRWRGANQIWPARGLVFVQITGPWNNPGVPPGAAYAHTHWIGTAYHDGIGQRFIFDVNGRQWLCLETWETEVIPLVVANHKDAAGWKVRTILAVEDGNGPD